MADHTPTPWLQAGATVYALEGEGRTARNKFSALVQAPRASSDEMEANAAFIVRAVNAHTDLVVALLSARAQLDHYENVISGESFNDTQINAALAKAEAL